MHCPYLVIEASKKPYSAGTSEETGDLSLRDEKL